MWGGGCDSFRSGGGTVGWGVGGGWVIRCRSVMGVRPFIRGSGVRKGWRDGGWLVGWGQEDGATRGEASVF